MYLGAPASLEYWWLAGTSTTLQLGVERRRQHCAGTETPPSWAISLSGNRDQDDRDCVHGRDLIVGSDTLRECFNNVDVGASLWQTEPRDKSSYREFDSFHPSLLAFAFHIATCVPLLS